MFSTVIEFASNPEVVNAQTFDSVGIIPLVLLVLVTASGLFFAYKKKVFASVGHKGLHLKQFEWYASKKFIATIFITVVAVACLCIFCISKSANAANALNVTTTDKVIGVVDEQTGKVTIDKAIVTNDEDHDLEFNSVSLALFPGINDGQCNWKISIAKDDEKDAEVVFDDVSNNYNIFYEPWQFEKGQKYTVTFEVTMDPAVAKSLEGYQIATVTYDVTEHQDRVNATINFNETTIIPAGKKVIERNGWIESPGNGTYQARKVKGSEIAPELVPFEQSMAAREIVRTYMQFDYWTINPELTVFSKDVAFSVNWKDRDGLRGFVVDGDGKPVEGAKVTAYDKDSGEILGELYTDDNGKYIFEFPPFPLGKDIIITTDKDGEPDLVAPSKEFHSYEPGGELGTSTADEGSSLKGHVNDLPDYPTTWAVFQSDDGNKYYAPVDKNGNYNLPVPADTPGNLFFENSDPSLNIEGFPNIETPDAGGSSKLPDSGVLPDQNMANVKYTLNPAIEDARLVITQYDAVKDAEHTYTTTTGHDGVAAMPVWPGMTGDVELTYYDVFTNQNVSYAENLDALEAGETYEKTINTTNVYKVTMNITDPGVLVNHVPSGWNFTGGVLYTKGFIEGSDIATINRQWKLDYLSSTTGRVFSGFSVSSGFLNKDTTISMRWWDESSRYRISGSVADVDGKPVKGIKVSIIGGEGYELGYVSTTDDKGNYQLYVRDAGNYFINATGYAGKYKDYVSKSSNFEIQEAIHEYTFNFIINPCAYIIGSYTFSGAGTNSVFTFKDSLGNEYKIDELTADSYTVRVPINTEGQIIGEPINHSAQPYKTLTYNITTPGAGESVTRDFYFYKDAEMCNVGGSLSYTDDSPTYQLEYYSEETQTSISQPYSGSPCQISFSVPPKSDGILKIVAGNNQTFLYDLQSGDPSSSISLGDIDFDQADAGHIDVEVKHGTFNDSLLPSGWTKLSSTKWTTEMYTKGSTVDLCLKGIEEAVLPEANYYFQYIDKSYQDATLGNALTASFVCDWYLCAPEKVYGKKDWETTPYQVGTMGVLGNYTDTVYGSKIVPFCSGLLFYDSNNNVQTIASAKMSDNNFIPTGWTLDDEGSEASGYVMSKLVIRPILYCDWTVHKPVWITCGYGGASFTDADKEKLNTIFNKNSETMWSTNVPYDRLGDSFAQVRSVLEFLDLNPVREGFTFAGWLIPENFSDSITARWVPNSEADGITKENIIVSVDDEIYQNAIRDMMENE